MDEEIKKQLNAQDELLEKIYKTSEKTRRYFMWVLIVSAVMFFLPLIGLLFVLPDFIQQYMSALGGL